MAITQKAIVRMFWSRRGTVKEIASRYRLRIEYVENAIRKYMRRAGAKWES